MYQNCCARRWIHYRHDHGLSADIPLENVTVLIKTTRESGEYLLLLVLFIWQGPLIVT